MSESNGRLSGSELLQHPTRDEMAEELKIGDELHATIDFASARAQANRKALLALMAAMRAEEGVIRLGGGTAALEAQHGKGRLTARERIKLLLDEETEFLELGLWAARGMYAEYGGAPCAGVVTGLGKVSGRLCMIVANDATVKAGAFFPMTAKKVLRAQTIAMENRIPTLYLVDSSGVFLPLQEDVFPDTDDFGRIFRNNAVMSSMGIPQITAIMGMCVAGGAYLPVMTDTVLMTEGSGLFLAGPSLVQAAIGEKTGPEELGGAAMHAAVSGTVDFKEPNDHLCLARLRSLVAKMGERAGNADVFRRRVFDAVRDAPKFAAEDVYGLLNPEPGSSNVYDMRKVIARIVDRSEFEEYKAEFGRTVLCGYAWIGGRAVGIVANQKTNQNQTVSMGPSAGMTQMEVGGDLHRGRAEGGALHHGLQSKPGAAGVSARCKWIHGRQGGRVVGNHSRRGKDGVRGEHKRGAEDYGDRGWKLWRRALRDVRQSLRSSLSVCVAHSAVCGDEWRLGGFDAGRGPLPADGAGWQGVDRGGESRALRRDSLNVRCAGRSALRRGTALD